MKWGIRPNLTLDATINTDFAQVEADEEQVNLTRFDLFFPEKRPFFLENASTFQFGNPQQIDLFFSRRIGLSATGVPIDILGGARLSGKLGGWNVGVLNIQTDEAENAAGTQVVGQANNFTALRMQREVGRSSYGAIFVNRQGTGSYAPDDDYNRAYGVDANIQLSSSQRVSGFLARTDSGGADGRFGSDYAGRGVLQLHQQPVADLRRLLAGRRDLQSRGRLPAAPRLPAPRVPRVLPAAAEERSSGSGASRRTCRTTRSTTSTATCRPRPGTSTRSRFSRGRAAASAGSSTTPRTTRRRRSRSTTATACAW